MACTAAFALGNLHLNVAGPAEFFVKIIAEACCFLDLNLQFSTLVRGVALGAFQFCLVFVMRKDNRLLVAFNMEFFLEIQLRLSA